MKNSKKGFTLVELVVVIAILAILAAIAIPVVSNTINSSKISGALSDAQTLELALKEADAQIVSQDKSVYTDGEKTTVSSVFTKKGIALKTSLVIKGSTYIPVWDFNDEKIYYVSNKANGTIPTGNAVDKTGKNPDITNKGQECLILGKDASDTKYVVGTSKVWGDTSDDASVVNLFK